MLKQPGLISSVLSVLKCNCLTYDDNIGPKFLKAIHDLLMSRKGPKVGQGMLDFVEDLR